MRPALTARRLLESLLELQPRQFAPLRPEVFEIRQAHLGNQSRVGIGRRAAAGRHAVHDRLGRIGHRRDDESSGAHAEGVDAAPALLAHERIGGGRQVLAARRTVVLDRVDERLGVFDAHAHSEGLGLDTHAAGMEQFVDVARRVARGQHHGSPLDPLVARADTADTAVAEQQVRYAAVETEQAARIEDRPADVPDDIGELVGADMGMRLVEDLGRGAVKDERPERLVVVAALLAAREELAVGKGSRAALAEGVVRVGGNGAVAVDLRDVALARRDVAAALQHDGPEAQLNQPQCGKEPRRTRSDNNDLRTSRDLGIIEMHGCGQRLAIDIDLECQIDLDLPLAGVDRAFDYPHQRKVRLPDTQTPGRQGGVKSGIGSLLRSQDESDGLRHTTEKLQTKIDKKAE